METGIGATLREARGRRKVDFAAVEAATKIRGRYLRAMENEEWDVLPGGAYTRGFIRTYAGYLGLDGERLADEYRRSTAPAGGERASRRLEPVAAGWREWRRLRIGPRAVAAIVSVALAGLLIAIGLSGGDDDGGAPAGAPGAGRGGEGRPPDSARQAAIAKPGVAVEVAATGEVWVCLLEAEGEELIDGRILEAGTAEGPFRAESFAAAFGNGDFELTIDGRPAETPPSASPVGYEIDSGGLTPLEEGERPDCE